MKINVSCSPTWYPIQSNLNLHYNLLIGFMKTINNIQKCVDPQIKSIEKQVSNLEINVFLLELKFSGARHSVLSWSKTCSLGLGFRKILPFQSNESIYTIWHLENKMNCKKIWLDHQMFNPLNLSWCQRMISCWETRTAPSCWWLAKQALLELCDPIQPLLCVIICCTGLRKHVFNSLLKFTTLCKSLHWISAWTKAIPPLSVLLPLIPN